MTAPKLLMASHLQELMQDAMEFPWENVRNFHDVFLEQCEWDKVTWDKTTHIQTLRRMYAQKAHVITIQKASKRDKKEITTVPADTTVKGTQGPLFRLSYQHTGCKHAGDHATSRGLVKHECAYCLKNTGQGFRHTEDECRRKARDGQTSKNDEP